MWGVVGSLFLAPGQDRLRAGETDRYRKASNKQCSPQGLRRLQRG